tara:strand:- start:25954 stop:27009 length:1056 start_codon:yes stop_codon:yes gene_type:complete
MSQKVNFKEAALGMMTLAKVGNSLREEPLQTSKTLCKFNDSEAELLTHCFLKSFRSLELHQLTHHGDLRQNELFAYATAIFDNNDTLLENGALIAKHLYAKSNHPNIKPGDLCVALIDNITVGGDSLQALSIIKSESKVPFLQVAVHEGDLKLTTQQGIYPDKIDKGCLIINCEREHGFHVYLFDKAGGETNFWNRDFVGAMPVKNEDYLTRRYSELCVAFAEEGLPEETRQEERIEVANKALSYLTETDNFNLDKFQNEALEDPGLIEQFTSFKNEYEEESGHTLDSSFDVSKKEATKAKKRLKGRMKLDVGVDLRFSSGFIDQSEKFMERGFDDDKHMQFVKVYYHKES